MPKPMVWLAFRNWPAMPHTFSIEPMRRWKGAMPSLKNVLPILARRAGYLDSTIPSPLPEPIPLLQAASMDTVMAALVAVPQELRQKPGLPIW